MSAAAIGGGALLRPRSCFGRGKALEEVHKCARFTDVSGKDDVRYARQASLGPKSPYGNPREDLTEHARTLDAQRVGRDAAGSDASFRHHERGTRVNPSDEFNQRVADLSADAKPRLAGLCVDLSARINDSVQAGLQRFTHRSSGSFYGRGAPVAAGKDRPCWVP